MMSVDLIHHDHRRGPQARFLLAQPVEVHDRVAADRLRQARHRRAAGDHRLEVLPAAAHAAAMLVEQLAQRNRHRLLHHAGPLHMPEIAKASCRRCSSARSPRTSRRRGAGWSARPRSSRRCSPSLGSHKAPRPPGRAASCAACPSCPRGSPAAPSPRRRCRRLLRGSGRGRSPSRACGVGAQQPVVIGRVDRACSASRSRMYSPRM